MKTIQRIVFLSAFIPCLFIDAAVYYFRNDYGYPAKFTVDYGTWLCSKDTINVQPHSKGNVNSKICCWDTITIKANNITKKIHLKDVFNVIQIAEMAACDEGTIFWINSDGSFGVNAFQRGNIKVGQF